MMKAAVVNFRCLDLIIKKLILLIFMMSPVSTTSRYLRAMSRGTLDLYPIMFIPPIAGVFSWSNFMLDTKMCLATATSVPTTGLFFNSCPLSSFYNEFR